MPRDGDVVGRGGGRAGTDDGRSYPRMHRPGPERESEVGAGHGAV